MAKERDYPAHSLSVDLNVKGGSVDITLRRKEDEDSEWESLETKSFAAGDVSSEVTDKVFLYGLSKKLQDAVSSIPVGPEKFPAMEEVFELLKSGTWERERVVGAPTVSAEVEALAEIKKITIPDAQRALRKYTQDQRKKILGNAQVVKRAAEIRADRAEAEAISLDDLAASAA
jgi:hypothetical protein